MTDDQVQDKTKPTRNRRCPLGHHRTGQWYKKIKGKFYYFGTDKSEAAKALFHWAQGNEMMDQGPELRAIKNVRKTKRKERDEQRIPSQKRQTFTAGEIQRLLQHADVKMTAMIWLGINCGFGGSDIGDLRWDDLDLEAGTVDLPRGKTGIPRHLTLWPQTIEALQRQVPRRGPLVFYTAQGKPWVRYHPVSGCRADNIGPRFRQLMDRAEIERHRGTGFYTLRRTAATIAAQSGDIFGLQGLMGHATTRTSSVYVQTVSHQAEKAVDLVREWYVRGIRNWDDQRPKRED